MEMELERAKGKWCHNDKENILKFRIEKVRNGTQQNKDIKEELKLEMHRDVQECSEMQLEL